MLKQTSDEVHFGHFIVGRFYSNANNSIMIGHYLKVSTRNLARYKTYSLLNVLGLAIAIASSATIFQYVLFEMSYDSFHSNAGRIFRIRSTR